MERRYPVGIQTFSEIIKGGYVYIDKTDLMWRMQRLSKFIFLSRPRRFGKSLLTTTLCSFFEGRRELFEGLKVMELEKEWRRYPVLHIDVSSAKGQESKEDLRKMLMLQLDPFAKIYGANPKETTPGGVLDGLIRRAYEQTGEQVVVVIDEYDAPLLEVLHEEEQLPAFRRVMQEFYQCLKAREAMIRFCFITCSLSSPPFVASQGRRLTRRCSPTWNGWPNATNARLWRCDKCFATNTTVTISPKIRPTFTTPSA